MMKNIFKNRICPLCGNENNNDSIKLIFEFENHENHEKYSISECLNCSFIHQNPSWNQEFYDDLYKFFYYPLDNELPNGYKERCKIICETISALNINNHKSKLLDFGCNNGSFINYAKENLKIKLNKIIGYDIQLRGIDKKDGFYNSFDNLCHKEGKFDIIVLNFVLEHILDPREFLLMISNKLLKNNGYLIIEVPDQSFVNNLDFHPFHIQHTNYFTPVTISTIFKNANLSTYQIKTYENYKNERDPNTPSLIAIAQKSANYCASGKIMEEVVKNNRLKMVQKIKKIGQNSRIGIVGCGDALHPLMKYSELNKSYLIALFDNNKKIQGKTIYGKSIFPIDEIKNFNLDVIIISTLFPPSIIALRKQISEYFDLKKLISFS